jgi:hypothetical protein
MSSNVQHYDAAVARCEALASDHGHFLSPWYPVDERLHASLCEECGAMVWVARTGHEEGWRVGGGALSQDCPGEELEEGLASS